MISQSQSVLLEAIKASLFNIEPNYHPGVNWNEVVEEAKAQTVMGLISPVVPIQDETSAQCKAFYMRIMFEQDCLIKCLNSAQIPCVILKGSAAAIYYPKPYLRTMGDIDVLVPRERFIESLEVLELCGYVYDHGKEADGRISEDTRELAYKKNGIIVEIHQRFSTSGVDVDDILEESLKSSEYVELNGYRFPILPSLVNGLVLIGHINQHLKRNVLGLRQIIDWEMYLHYVSENEDWNLQFIPLVKEKGLLTLAAYVTRLCNKYLGLTDEVCFGIDVDETLVDELLNIVLTDGNFGRRVYTNKTEDETKFLNASYNIKQLGFFGYFTRIGFGTSAFCRKHPSLKLFAFFYGATRLFFKGLSVWSKNIAVSKSMCEGKELYKLHLKRQALFNKLGVKTDKE